MESRLVIEESWYRLNWRCLIPNRILNRSMREGHVSPSGIPMGRQIASADWTIMLSLRSIKWSFATEPVEAAKLILGHSGRCEPTVARSITHPFPPFFL
ncbi:hypothetical protein AG1IA_03125 [Rhizoctonia solani AG-1 IA]|uniref:Uncharacterized protein n=1 Tax=Thanatephorus cucumeris (strain AG1-IA) TaxID=983506 RepID=L8X187_THACA|nr:hypothetical protein AG1IA_03125 [Rhizoctonia solani AG-1 IA]